MEMRMDHKTRETWLQSGITKLRPHFEAKGYPIPDNVRVSCGLPSVGAFASKRSIGEAWCSKASKDKHFEIFISPTVEDAYEVLAVLTHELVHVAVGIDKGHKGPFPIAAAQVGLAGPWTSTKAHGDFAEKLQRMADMLGKYPHATLNKMTNGRKKQSTRLIKANCDECGYTMRVAMKWLLNALPVCPDPECNGHLNAMSVELQEEAEELKAGV